MKSVEHITLPQSSPGTTRTLKVIRYEGSGHPAKVYIQAGLHADEAPGYVVLKHLLDRLDLAESKNGIKGEIVLVPAANPIGLSQWRDETLSGRFDLNNSINFNRQHIDLTERIANKISGQLGSDGKQNVKLIRKTAAEILASIIPDDEATFLKHSLITLSHDADIVLDLHCDLDAVVHVYMGTPLWPAGSDLSAHIGAAATLLASESGGTPFDEANSKIWWELANTFPTKPIPPACLSATVELRGLADTARETAIQDADNLFAFLVGRGIISGEKGQTPPLVSEASPLTGVDFITAQSTGIVTYFKNPGDKVKQGDIIAEIFNPLADDETRSTISVRTITDGILFARNTDRFARPGRIIAKVAGSKPLREEKGDLLTL